MASNSDIQEILDYLDTHLSRKFPVGVAELRNYIFNTHSKLEDWMGAVITRESFKYAEASSIETKLKGQIMGDASIQVHRLLSVAEFHMVLKVFLKSVDDSKLHKDLKDKIEAVNRIRNEFAHPAGNFDLRAYDASTIEGTKNQIEVLTKLRDAIGVMEQYLLTYHKAWYLEVSKL